MKVGVVLPQGWMQEYRDLTSRDAWANSVAIAQSAEHMGFESVWMYDHFHTWPGPEDVIVFEPFVALSALAVRPDVMLLDIDLPGMNGIQMLEELSPRLPDRSIVMLTVSDSERDLIDALARGAAGYLTKDLAPEALLRALRGTQQGQLAMSRRHAAVVMRHFIEAARKGRSGSAGGLEGLSPRENDVLRMLADGLTDREIAQALVISPRTVETHVSNILHKLGVRKRSQAAQR